MARDDESQTGPTEEPPTQTVRRDEFRSRVGVDRVADLDRRAREEEEAAPEPELAGPRKHGLGLLASIRQLFRERRKRRRKREAAADLERPPPPAESAPEPTEAKPAGRGAGRNRPTDDGAHASSGRSGSRRAVKESTRQQMGSTVRGAGSSGEVRGATTGPRPATRVAGSPTRGTAKKGARRGSSKSAKRRAT
jgi:hypothetical protein